MKFLSGFFEKCPPQISHCSVTVYINRFLFKLLKLKTNRIDIFGRLYVKLYRIRTLHIDDVFF